MNPRHLFTLLVLLASSSVQALSSDRDQTLTLQADYVELDGSKGISHYKGRVVMKQGSFHLEAQSLSIFKGEKAIDRVEARGEPVHFRQLPDGKDTPIRGFARQILYDAAKGVLILRGEARVEQDQDVFSGEEIRYDTRNSLVQASGADDGKQRVHAVIHPRGSTPEPAALQGRP